MVQKKKNLSECEDSNFPEYADNVSEEGEPEEHGESPTTRQRKTDKERTKSNGLDSQ